MMKVAWCVLLTMIVALVSAALPAAAAQEGGGGGYVNVAGVQPFSAESNYMSLAGYLRWMTYVEQQVWLSMPEATRIVTEQVGGQ